ncbi:MAG: hypothetical protein ACKPCP_33495, partial [Sphaerospermopsis kisseleviana]
MTIIANTLNGKIGFIDSLTGQFEQIASISTTLTDIAVDRNGQIYANSFSRLYRVNRSTGTVSLVGNLGGTSFNALEFSIDGKLWGINDNLLYQINPINAEITFAFNLGFTSSGDLVFDAINNRFYATGRPSLSGSDFLYSIQLSSSLSTVTRVTQIGNIGYSNVWGLAFEGSTLHGYTSSNQDIIINTSSGAGSFNKNINGLVGEAIGGADSFLVSRDFNKDGKTDILLNNPNQGWNTA